MPAPLRAARSPQPSTAAAPKRPRTDEERAEADRMASRGRVCKKRCREVLTDGKPCAAAFVGVGYSCPRCREWRKGSLFLTPLERSPLPTRSANRTSES